MSLDDLAAAYQTAQQAYDQAVKAQRDAGAAALQATIAAQKQGKPPSSCAPVAAIEKAAKFQGDVTRATAAAATADADLAAKTTARDQAWAALVAVS